MFFVIFPCLDAHLGSCLASWPQHGPQDLQDDHHKPQDAPKSLPKVAFQALKMAVQAPKMAPKTPKIAFPALQDGLGILFPLQGQQPRTIKKPREPRENQHVASFPLLAANLGSCLAS